MGIPFLGENVERRFLPLQPCPSGQHQQLPEEVQKRYDGWTVNDVLLDPQTGKAWVFAFRPKEVA